MHLACNGDALRGASRVYPRRASTSTLNPQSSTLNTSQSAVRHLRHHFIVDYHRGRSPLLHEEQ